MYISCLEELNSHAAPLRCSPSPWAKWHRSPKVQVPFTKFSHSFVL
uniref:Uncharacterized protein n=1 Tax=Arundo donax TaxID=35708 RepID=A0A0A9G118_ARUDO